MDEVKLRYREFSTLTDDEIKFICKEILSMKDVIDIERDDNEIEVDVVDECVEGATGERFDIDDYVTLTPTEIKTYNFSLTKQESEDYQRYLFSLGMDWRLKDNKFLKQERG